MRLTNNEFVKKSKYDKLHSGTKELIKVSNNRKKEIITLKSLNNEKSKLLDEQDNIIMQLASKIPDDNVDDELEEFGKMLAEENPEDFKLFCEQEEAKAKKMCDDRRNTWKNILEKKNIVI